jgi:hypothetical protein
MRIKCQVNRSTARIDSSVVSTALFAERPASSATLTVALAHTEAGKE